MIEEELPSSPGEGDDPGDGRVQRRVSNRQSVLDALSRLVAGGSGDPTIDELAEAAGVSSRSIQRYFGSLDAARDELRAAIVDEVLRYLPHASGPVMPGASLEDRCASLVASRFELYDRIGLVVRNSTSRRVASEETGARFAEARAMVDGQVFERFEPELAPLDPDERDASLAVVNALLSFESINVFLGSPDAHRGVIGRRLVTQLMSAFGG